MVHTLSDIAILLLSSSSNFKQSLTVFNTYSLHLLTPSPIHQTVRNSLRLSGLTQSYLTTNIPTPPHSPHSPSPRSLRGCLDYCHLCMGNSPRWSPGQRDSRRGCETSPLFTIWPSSSDLFTHINKFIRNQWFSEWKDSFLRGNKLTRLKDTITISKF